uniref:Cerebral dopamine neurotrophic factor n=1 Tax=Lates calcarifer TaxID=8187 RepID=A0A4W6ELS0_LATCA
YRQVCSSQGLETFQRCLLNWSAVCVSFLHRLYGSLNSAHMELTPALVEEELIQACSVAQGKEARLVRTQHYTMMRQHASQHPVSRPLASHVPVEKICQRLSSRDTQICELRYGKPQLNDLSSDRLKKLRVLELRNILASWGEECRGCLEKHEFVSLIQEKAPLHAHSTEL